MNKSLKIINSAKNVGRMMIKYNTAFWIYRFYDDLYRGLHRSIENITFDAVACFSWFSYSTSTIRPIFNELRKQGIQCKWVSKPINDGINYIYIASNLLTPRDIANQTIYIPHGIGYEFPHIFHIIYNTLLLPGLNDLKLFTNKPFRKDQLKLIGYPKSDILFSPDKDLIVENTKNRFCLDLPYEKTILYAPSFNFFSSSPFDSSFDKSIFPVMSIAQDLEMNLIIKTHPFIHKNSNKEIYFKAQQLSKKIKNVFWIDKDVEDIIPLYLFSDVLVSDASSVLNEFMLTDKPSIQLTNIPSKKLLYEGTTKSSLEDLPNTIIKVIDNPSEYLYEQRKQIKRRVFKPDGHASERAVEIIKKLMD